MKNSLRSAPLLKTKLAEGLACIDLFLISSPEPIAAAHHESLRQALSCRGYDVLDQAHMRMLPGLPCPNGHEFLLILVAQDLQPTFLHTEHGLINQRVFKAATTIGRRLRKDHAFVMTAKNQASCRQLLPQLLPERTELIYRQAQANQDAFQPPYPVIYGMASQAARSRIDVVEFCGGKAVCKTFRPGALDYLRREIEARRVLSMPEIAPILEHGSNYIVMPLFEEGWRWQNSVLWLYPALRARRCMDFMRRCFEAGFAVVDWHPGIFLFDRGNNLHVVDLEYLMPAPVAASFAESFDIAGPAKNFDGTLPAGRPITYKNTWQPLIGVSLKNLLDARTAKLHGLRAVYWLTRWLPKWLFDKVGAAFGHIYHMCVHENGRLVGGALIRHWPRPLRLGSLIELPPMVKTKGLAALPAHGRRALSFLAASAVRVACSLYAIVLLAPDRRVPWIARGIMVLAVAYWFSPVSLIPNNIPVIGYFDEIALTVCGAYFSRGFIPENVRAERWAMARRAFSRAGSAVG